MSNPLVEYRTRIVDGAGGAVLRRLWYEWVIGLPCVLAGPLILLPYWAFVAHKMRWASLSWVDYGALVEAGPIIIFTGAVLTLPATPFAWLFLLTGYKRRPLWLMAVCFFPIVNGVALGLCWAFSS